MKKLKTLMLAGLCAAMLTPMQMKATFVADSTTKTEWLNENGTYYINQNGEHFKGWYKDEFQCWYFMDYQTGAMKKGWVAGDATHWYYFKPSNGQMVTGWYEVSGTKYYFLTSGKYAGAMATGDVEVDGKTMRFSDSGAYVGEVSDGVVTSANRGTPIWSGYEKYDNLIKGILDEIIKPGMTEIEELKAIYTWVAENIDYGYGSITEWYNMKELGAYDKSIRNEPKEMTLWWNGGYYSHLYTVILGKGGVCNDYAQVFESLASARGFRATNFTGWGNQGIGHVVGAVWLDGSWKLVDCDVAADTRPISYDYFLKDSFSYFELGNEFDLNNPDYGEIQTFGRK